MTPNIAEYILTAKRTHALVYGDGIPSEIERFRKLAQRFSIVKYSSAVPEIAHKFPKMTKICPITSLFPQIEYLAEFFSEKFGIETVATVFASATMCAPIITFSREPLEKLSPMATMKFRTEPKEATAVLLKRARHLAEHSFVKSVGIFEDFASGKIDLPTAIKRRRNLALDAFRTHLWELGDGTTGETVALALDPLLLIPEKLTDQIINTDPVLFATAIALSL